MLLKINELLLKFWSVLSNKKNFFKKVKKEKTIKKALLYFVVLTALILIILTNNYVSNINDFFQYLYDYTGLEAFNVTIQITPTIFIAFYIYFLTMMTLLAFGRYFFVHITVKLFKSNASYKDTYNSLCYSITPGYVAIPFLVSGLVLLVTRFKVIAYIFLLIYASLEIYSFYIRSKGIAEVHDFSFWRGFACLYIYSNILLIVTSILLVLAILVTIFTLSFFLNFLVEVFL